MLERDLFLEGTTPARCCRHSECLNGWRHSETATLNHKYFRILGEGEGKESSLQTKSEAATVFALQFVREHIIHMPQEDYINWLQTRINVPARPQTART